MKKLSVVAVIFVVLVISFSSPVMAQTSSKILMMPREGYSSDLDLMIKMEVGVMTVLLKNAGYAVDIATTSGQSIIGPTEKIEQVKRLSEVSLDNYAGVIIPCMGVGMFPGPPVSSEAVGIARKAIANGKPVAAAGNASIVLAEGGMLKGKKYAYITDPLKKKEGWPRTDQRFEGAIYSGPGVVQDGKIITSGVCPNLEKRFGMQNGTVELTQKFIAAVGSK